MTPDCERLHLFADGELEAAEADAFRLHLASCAACQRGLDDVLQLDSLGEQLGRATQIAQPAAAAAQGARVLDLTAAREKRRRPVALWVAGAAAAAAALVLVVRVPRESDVFGLGATRPLEARLTHPGASEYRPYDVVRAAGAARAPVPLAALAKLEEKGDLRGLAEGHLLRGERAQAAAALDRAKASPDTQSDRAVAALQGGQADEALLLLEPVLAAHPQHAQALWNSGLALRELGLPLAAAEAFDAAAALNEPGWAREASARSAALRGAAKQAESDWQEARRAGPRAGAAGNAPRAGGSARAPGRVPPLPL